MTSIVAYLKAKWDFPSTQDWFRPCGSGEDYAVEISTNVVCSPHLWPIANLLDKWQKKEINVNYLNSPLSKSELVNWHIELVIWISPHHRHKVSSRWIACYLLQVEAIYEPLNSNQVPHHPETRHEENGLFRLLKSQKHESHKIHAIFSPSSTNQECVSHLALS